jgi:hypothetical protein
MVRARVGACGHLVTEAADRRSIQSVLRTEARGPRAVAPTNARPPLLAHLFGRPAISMATDRQRSSRGSRSNMVMPRPQRIHPTRAGRPSRCLRSRQSTRTLLSGNGWHSSPSTSARMSASALDGPAVGSAVGDRDARPSRSPVQIGHRAASLQSGRSGQGSSAGWLSAMLVLEGGLVRSRPRTARSDRRAGARHHTPMGSRPKPGR